MLDLHELVVSSIYLPGRGRIGAVSTQPSRWWPQYTKQPNVKTGHYQWLTASVERLAYTTIFFSIQRLQGYQLMQLIRGYSRSARKLSSKLKYPVSCLRHMLRSVQLNIYINIQNKSQNLSHNLQNTRGAKQ